MPSHLGIVEHAVEDFEFGDGLAFLELFPEPFFFFEQLLRTVLRHPAVAFAEQTDEVGAAAFDFLQTNGQHLALGGLPSVTPQRKSTSPQVTPRDSQSLRNCGKMNFTK